MEYTGKWKGMKLTEEDNYFGKWEEETLYKAQLPNENDFDLEKAVDEGDTSDYEIKTFDKIFGVRLLDCKANDLKTVECLAGYKIIIVLHTVDWCPGCREFKQDLIKYYNKYNKDGQKYLQVV